MKLEATPSFRPLTGKLVLIRIEEKGNNHDVCAVSVPLRGSWFWSTEWHGNDYTTTTKVFPSPYGEVGFDQERRESKMKKFEVSVPLRGSWFWSANMLACIANGDYEVSVPLRGSWFWSLLRVPVSRLLSRFPSPYGEVGFDRLPKMHQTARKMC